MWQSNGSLQLRGALFLFICGQQASQNRRIAFFRFAIRCPATPTVQQASAMRPVAISQASKGCRRAVVASAAAAAPSLPPATLSSARILYATAGAPAHDYPGHAECAARVPAILTALETQGLTAAARPGPVRPLHPRCTPAAPPLLPALSHLASILLLRLASPSQLVELTGFQPALRSDILAIHDEKYVATLELASSRSAGSGQALVVEPAPTYVTGSTNGDAFLAAGAVLALVDNVVAASRQQEASSSGGGGAADGATVPAAFAICRPPGHHSLPAGAMGFCIFSNVAIAARYAQKQHGLQRVSGAQGGAETRKIEQ